MSSDRPSPSELSVLVETCVWATLDRLDFLDGHTESFDAGDYVTMIGSIREIAAETGYSAADVGYALFAYDENEREGTLH